MKNYQVTISFIADGNMRAILTQWGITFRVKATSPLRALASIKRSEQLNAELKADKKLKRQFNNGAGVMVRLENLGKVKP